MGVSLKNISKIVKNSFFKNIISYIGVIVLLGIIAYFLVVKITPDTSSAGGRYQNGLSSAGSDSTSDQIDYDGMTPDSSGISEGLKATDTELAQNLMLFKKKDITVPEPISLKEFEGVILKSSLNKADLATELAGSWDISSGSVQNQLFSTGPGFVMKNGGELEIYMPTIPHVLDKELINLGNSLVRVNISSIIDKKGSNVLNDDSPFEKNSFFNQLKFESRLITINNQNVTFHEASRALRLKGNLISATDDIKKINGTVLLYLPVNLNKYTISNEKVIPKTVLKAGKVSVTISDIKNGAIDLDMKGVSRTVVYIKLFKSADESMSSTMFTFVDSDQFAADGFNQQSTISFDPTQKIDHIEIYVPSELITKKYNFAL